MLAIKTSTSLLLIAHLAVPGAFAGTHPESGDRVRVTVAAPGLGDRFDGLPRAGEHVEGMFVDTEDGDLLLRLASGARVRVPRAAVARLEVSEGRHGNAGKGAIIGLGVGLGLGVAMVGSTERDSLERGLAALDSGPLVLVAAVTGLVLGAASKSERWAVVETPGVKLSLAPQPGGVGVRVRF